MSGTVLRRAALVLTLSFALALAAPIFLVAAGAFVRADFYGVSSEGLGGGTLGLFAYVWRIWGGAMTVSSRLAATVTPVALLVAVPAAYGIRRHPYPGARRLESAALSLLAVPGVALAFALIQAAGGVPRFALLAAAHLVYAIPMALKTVGHSLDLADARLEDAARTLGAGPVESFRRALLPQIAAALALSALTTFTISWGEFNASFLLATPVTQTFPAALYSTYTSNSFPVASAATVLFLLPALPALIALQRIGGEDFARGVRA